MAPYQELRHREETIDMRLTYVRDISSETNVCWKSLVGGRVGLGYLGRY